MDAQEFEGKLKGALTASLAHEQAEIAAFAIQLFNEVNEELQEAIKHKASIWVQNLNRYIWQDYQKQSIEELSNEIIEAEIAWCISESRKRISGSIKEYLRGRMALRIMEILQTQSPEIDDLLDTLHREIREKPNANQQVRGKRRPSKREALLNELHEQLLKVKVACLTGLSRDTAYRLRELCQRLPLQERIQLSRAIFNSGAWNAWFDYGSVFESWVELDSDDEERPLAYMVIADSEEVFVETVDILASVKANPMAVWHPVIAFAIAHWRRIIAEEPLWQKTNSRSEYLLAIQSIFHAEASRFACKHLRAISNAAKRVKPLRKPTVLMKSIIELGITEADNTNPLFVAWELLDWKTHIKPTQRECRLNNAEQVLESRLAQIREALSRLTNPSNDKRVSQDTVLDFLANAGKLYVYDDGQAISGVQSSRRAWVEFRNAFICWRTGESLSNLHKSLTRANELPLYTDEPYDMLWRNPIKQRIWGTVFENLSVQLVTIGEPVILSKYRLRKDLPKIMQQRRLDSKLDKK